MVSMFHYAVSINIMMIVIEYFQDSHYSILLIIILVMESAGKLVAVQLVDIDLTQENWALAILVPIGLFYVISSLAVPESPRYWISQDII